MTVARTTHERHTFRPLDQDDFRALEHAAYLKGLLRPFKGKGDLDRFAQQCASLRDALIQLTCRRVLPQMRRYPFDLLGIELAQHSTRAGTTFLRWRKIDGSAMGVALWDDMMLDPRTPVQLLPDLLRIEHQRVTANMQISLTHSLARQALACATKLAHADALHLALPPHPTTPEDSP